MISYPTRGRSYELQHEDFHNTNAPNQFKVYGALVGGPQSDDRCTILPCCRLLDGPPARLVKLWKVCGFRIECCARGPVKRWWRAGRS